MKLALRFASGPLAFLLLWGIPPSGLTPPARLTLAVFAWMIAWWMAQPVPWAISSLLPLVLFPLLGLMSIGDAAALYGQEVFFWVWGTVLMGYALDRHGLAKRFALWFLSLPWVAGSMARLAFGYMLAAGLISTVISDAATVAMMIPVGVSLVSFVRQTGQLAPSAKSNFGSFIALGTLYAAVAGGTATLAGIPHNAVSNSLLESLTGSGLSWFGWMRAGMPIFLVTLGIFYFLLRAFFPLERSRIPGGAEFVRSERQKLGSLGAGERATLAVFLVMVLLFTLPSLLAFALGAQHPASRW
ncbi:MAG TPA: SLC13 family permease, partial [Terriglobia bacterium]|nr:SLC13 family permease [Terriglobia bacterium]